MTPGKFCIEIYQIVIFWYYRSYIKIGNQHLKTDSINIDFDFGFENFDSINLDFDFKRIFNLDQAWMQGNCEKEIQYEKLAKEVIALA